MSFKEVEPHRMMADRKCMLRLVYPNQRVDAGSCLPQKSN